MNRDEVVIRKADAADLPAIIALLADDDLGRLREDVSLPVSQAYLNAFAAIDRDPQQFLAVAVEAGQIVGTLQLTFIPGLSRKGAWRGQIESVRIAASHRNAGLGQVVITWAIEQCRARGCNLVQLTTDKSRTDAHRFYQRLGFTASHDGYKLALEQT